MNEASLKVFKFKQSWQQRLQPLWKVIKENKSLILLVPTLLGGALQLFQLANIDVVYIKFFSVTQVIPDGLMCLTAMLYLIVCFLYVVTVIYYSPSIDIKDSKKKTATKYIVLIISLFFLKFLYNLEIKETSIVAILFKLFLLLNLFFLSCYIIYSTAYILYYVYLKKCNLLSVEYDEHIDNLAEIYKKIIEIIILTIIAIFLVIISYSLKDIFTKLNDTKNINNFTVLSSQIINQSLTPYKIKPKILYFNRDFIFIEIQNHNSCRCDVNILCDDVAIINNRKWINSEVKIIEGKMLFPTSDKKDND